MGEICFVSQKEKGACLSFFNTKNRKWECEDKCLENVGSQVCGKTDHLTSFSLLLAGGSVGESCSSNSDYLFAWLSAAFVLFAIILVLLAVLANEVAVQRNIYTKKKAFAKIE